MADASEPTYVLVVDDDAASRRLVELALRGLEVEVFTCDDPEAVSKMVRDLEPAVLVLDVMMPSLDGPHVVETLRAAGDLKMPKVVLWSALDAPTLQVKGKSVNADAVVLKVAGPAALVQEVGRLLDLWHS